MNRPQREENMATKSNALPDLQLFSLQISLLIEFQFDHMQANFLLIYERAAVLFLPSVRIWVNRKTDTRTGDQFTSFCPFLKAHIRVHASNSWHRESLLLLWEPVECAQASSVLWNGSNVGFLKESGSLAALPPPLSKFQTLSLGRIHGAQLIERGNDGRTLFIFYLSLMACCNCKPFIIHYICSW